VNERNQKKKTGIKGNPGTLSDNLLNGYEEAQTVVGKYTRARRRA